MFKLQAVLHKPESLFRIAFNELLEDKKLLRLSATKKGINYSLEEAKIWSQFKSEYMMQFPTHELIEKEMKIWEMAKIAELSPYYETCYRFYCQATHVTFRAAVGGLKYFEDEDNTVMATCVCSGLRAIISTGVELNIEPLIDRLLEIDRKNKLSYE